MNDNTMLEYYIGLMSGTSIDSVDAALVGFKNNEITIIASHEHPIPTELRENVISLCETGDDEINRAGVVDRELGALFAEAALALVATSDIERKAVVAIGSHGQTIRHHPTTKTTPSKHAFTLQIGDPNTIAAHTGITTVADFRRMDIALGGQGAPLAPVFHKAFFSSQQHHTAVINIGGIANITYLPFNGEALGFDCGPGNGLMDLWIQRHQGSNFDKNGAWASQGNCHQELLSLLMNEDYLSWTPPKSTGRELFNGKWLDQKLSQVTESSPVDIQATLLEFTARVIQNHLEQLPETIADIFLCGGGAHNKSLVNRLQKLMTPAIVTDTSSFGIDPEWVEAAAFAWLARQTLSNLPGNLPGVTGASSRAILGAIYPGISKI
tara:strand:+ start:550 stop:1695 length:1146 start_codon:yes stop_codon:yes gene_type:complete